MLLFSRFPRFPVFQFSSTTISGFPVWCPVSQHVQFSIFARLPFVSIFPLSSSQFSSISSLPVCQVFPIVQGVKFTRISGFHGIPGFSNFPVFPVFRFPSFPDVPTFQVVSLSSFPMFLVSQYF